MLKSRNTIILTSSLLLAACGAEEDSKNVNGNPSSLTSALVPAINTNLDSDSPTGIWMLATDEEITSETRGVENITEDSYWQETENYKLDYSATTRTYIRITQPRYNQYKIESCHIYDQVAVNHEAPSDVDTHYFSHYDDYGNNWSYRSRIGEIGNLENVTHNYRRLHQDINIDSNLSLSGTILDQRQSYNDTYPGREYFHEITRKVNLVGVKISDATNFSEATDLTFGYKMSNAHAHVEDSKVLSNDEMNCLSVSEYKVVGNLEGEAIDSEGISIRSLFDENDELVELKVEQDNLQDQDVKVVSLISNANGSDLSLSATCSGESAASCDSLITINNNDISGFSAALIENDLLLNTELTIELLID